MQKIKSLSESYLNQGESDSGSDSDENDDDDEEALRIKRLKAKQSQQKLMLNRSSSLLSGNAKSLLSQSKSLDRYERQLKTMLIDII
jgi:hypothetical protein